MSPGKYGPGPTMTPAEEAAWVAEMQGGKQAVGGLTNTDLVVAAMEPGQNYVARELVKATGLTSKEVRGTFDWLRSTGEVEREPVPRDDYRRSHGTQWLYRLKAKSEVARARTQATS